jgi:hypothetical protein
MSNHMAHIGNGTYRCLLTNKLYTRRVVWEFRTQVVVYEIIGASTFPCAVS